MSARTKGLLKRVGVIEKAIAIRHGGDSIEELSKYLRAADDLPRNGDFIVASDDEITALAEAKGIDPERLRLHIELRNKIIRDDDC
ncbi:hypothetical protein [Aeromonas caviae]|uniref:hypothetical protein n=1 Tax=Aeromonas caviae TaxID=648 RepID=UPI001CC57BCD|nr:hypothetical protein [Aeromonas caviae]GJB04319.1 hypothetical protein KAM360_32620 [Aeromonas caviae]GKR44771.1 hypothetical protein KAM473_22900 [Aeromonas caviae]GKR52891.1 hypothetical protein KAM475_20380 [Aeromonas caviae]GKR63534.1 hypothetical protein KAM477_41560 [Aeromonas caviae]GKR87580.1 hypothetical protein KAM483_24810 [Aeromonas caviae]